MIHFFQDPVPPYSLPERFTDPFHYIPHPLCKIAAKEVQDYLYGLDLWEKSPEEGKMFGVLIVRTPTGKTGFLAAFSGIFQGSYLHPWFVPPVYNLQQPEGFFRREEEKISAINEQIQRLLSDPEYQKCQQELAVLKQHAQSALSAAKAHLKAAKAARDFIRHQYPENYDENAFIRESQFQKAEYKRSEQYWKEQISALQVRTDVFSLRIEALKTERHQRSAALQQQLFEQFRFLNAQGEEKNLCDIFRESGRPTPPAGAGECAAPKLLQYAYTHHLRPIAMAEFWWGCSPKTEIRKQGNYYPACKGKCAPILNHMLKGLLLDKLPGTDTPDSMKFPEILYEDEWLLVVNKPAGLLTVPGKTSRKSLYDMLRERYPQANGPLIIHRLDMATSGLIVVAKDKNVHEHLQRQFLNHTIRKKYIALLDGILPTDEGCICLPLCPDPDDRPRQLVSETYGKPAITRYQVLARTARQTRIAFYPETGRTHQLRVHAAHPRGLNCPISGDELYGQKNERMYLHAEYIAFFHPVSGQKMQFEKKADF